MNINILLISNIASVTITKNISSIVHVIVVILISSTTMTTIIASRISITIFTTMVAFLVVLQWSRDVALARCGLVRGPPLLGNCAGTIRSSGYLQHRLLFHLAASIVPVLTVVEAKVFVTVEE